MVSKTYKNPQAKAPLASGVPRFARSTKFHNKGVWAIVKKGVSQTAAPVDATKPTQKTFGKKAKTVNVYPKLTANNYNPKIHSAKAAKTARPAKLRASITPGTVLILLAGRFAGKRVVFLKQLESGLLLVTGPYKVNGVPLKRVSQAYVIATSQKVDVSGVKTDAVSDNLWKKQKDNKQKGEKKFFKDGEKEKKAVPQEFVQIQTQVDEAISAAVEKVQFLKEYLSTSFALSNGVFPHNLKF